MKHTQITPQGQCQSERYHNSAAAVRAIDAALASQSEDGWQAVAIVLGIRLAPDQCAGLAWAALTASSRDDAIDVAHDVLGDAGPPVAPFVSVWPEARAWASMASDTEVRAYGAAVVEAMPADTRTAFLDWAGRAQA